MDLKIKIEDDELSARLDLFMSNLVNNGDVDNIVILTNRGDRVGIATNGKDGPSNAVAFAMMKVIVESKKSFKHT